jgi:hypothetical protein
MRIPILIASAFILVVSCTELEKAISTGNTIVGGTSGEKKLTNDQVIAGLKEALSVGTNNSAKSASAVGGFLNNPLIVIPFPPDAIKVKEKVESLGMKDKVDKFVATMNNGAEEAAKEAAPIFLNAITSMSVADGFNILNGADNAATKYLEEKTSSALYNAFKPKVQEALKKVKLTEHWNPIINKYNAVTTVTGGEKINPDLDDYVTKGALKGLFTLIEGEEKKIRLDPMARVSDLLKDVFGSLDKK